MNDEQKQEAAVQIWAAVHATWTVGKYPEEDMADVMTLAAMLAQSDRLGPIGGLERIRAVLDEAGNGLRGRLG